jgi:hypothetical protein
MGVLTVILGSIVAIFVIAWVITALLMLLAAKISGVQAATFGRAVLAAFGCSFVTWLCAALFSIVPGVGTLLGAIVGVLLSIFVISGVFHAGIGRSFLVWVFNAVGQVVAVVIAVLTFAGALFGVGSSVAHSATHTEAGMVQSQAVGSMQDARAVAAALEAYATDLNKYPNIQSEADLGVISPQYIKTIPPGLSIKSNASGYVISSSTGEVLLKSGQ